MEERHGAGLRMFSAKEVLMHETGRKARMLVSSVDDELVDGYDEDVELETGKL